MKVVELINIHKDKKNFSFEVLPPLKGTGTGKLFATIDKLKEFDPLYINITTHHSEYVYRELDNGQFERMRIRRRPGTVAIAAAIQQKYGIPVIPHVICSGATIEHIEYELLDLQFLGIDNLLLLRGDKAKDDRVFTPVAGGHAHTTDLIEQVNNSLTKISIGLLIVAALLTFISFSLINNTVRLGIYARRFSIHTMKLVGASWGFIRKPFLTRAMMVGVISALIADGFLGGCLYAWSMHEPELLNVLGWQELAITGGSVFLFGLIITALCANISVNKFLKMKAGDLYKI